MLPPFLVASKVDGLVLQEMHPLRVFEARILEFVPVVDVMQE